MDLSDVTPIVPRSQIRVEDDLLNQMGAELSRLSSLAHNTIAFQSPQASSPPPNHDDALKQFGEQLFTQLFPIPTRQRLMQMEPSHLFLRLDDQLVHLPWELAFDGRDFLLNRFHIGRQVVTHQRPEGPLNQAAVSSDKPKMLLVVDPTETLKAAVEEAMYLCDLLDTGGHVEVMIRSGRQLRKLDLLQELNNYDLVHYAGHAFFDADHPERSGWILHDSILTASELSRLPRPPQLVFSNACQAGVTSRWTAEALYDDQAFGIGSAFLLAGTQNYIGTFCVIHDTHSATFAAHFYESLLQGNPVGVALSMARQHARQHADESGLLWASYMHYGNPTFRLPGAKPHYPSGPASLATAFEQPRISPQACSSRPDEFDALAAPSPRLRLPRLRVSHVLRAVILLFLIMCLALLTTRPWRKGPPELAELTTGYQWIEQGMHEKAKTHFQQLTHQNAPRLRGEAYAGLAAVALAQGACEQAIAYADKAERQEPKLASIDVIKGHVLWKQGHMQEAEAAYRTALNKSYQLPQQVGVVHNRLGLMAVSQDEPDRALEHYNRAYESHRDPAVVLVNKGNLLEKLGRYEEAAALYRQAADLNPDEPLAAILLQDAKRRHEWAQDAAERARIDQLVEDLLAAHRARRPQDQPREDTWTSRPLVLALLDMEKPALPIARAGEAEAFWIRLSQLLQDNPRLDVVEREVLEQLLSELKLGTSTLAEAQTALRVGQILAARFMVTGRFLRLSMHGQYSVRVIETEKTRIAASAIADVETPAQTRQAAEDVASMLAKRLYQDYPLRGRINAVGTQTATLNIGTELGVVPGLRLYVYQGDDARIDKIVALVEVTQVDAEQSQARVIKRTMVLQPGWKVEEEVETQ